MRALVSSHVLCAVCVMETWFLTGEMRVQSQGSVVDFVVGKVV